MSGKDLDNIFKKGLGDLESPFNPEAWKEAEVLINEMEGNQRRRPLIPWIIGAVVGILGIIGGLNLIQSPDAADQAQTETAAIMASNGSSTQVPEANTQSPEATKGGAQAGDQTSAMTSPIQDATPNYPSGTSAKPVVATVETNEQEPLDDGSILTASSETKPIPLIEESDRRFIEPIDVSAEDDIVGPYGTAQSSSSSFRIDLLAGIPFSTEGGNENSGTSRLPFYAGINLVFVPSLRWEFALGSQFEQIRYQGSTLTIEQQEFSFGLTETIYSITPNYLNYWSFPLTASYMIHPRHRLSGGLQYSRLMQVYSDVEVSYSNNSNPPRTDQSSESGYLEGFNQNQMIGILGYSYNLKSRLRLDLQARMGLTPIAENQNPNNVEVKVGLTYHLWSR